MADLVSGSGENRDSSELPKKSKSRLDELPKEELLIQVKKYLNLLQTAKNKFTEVNKKCASLEEERDGAFVVIAKLKSANNVGSIDELQDRINGLEKNAVHLQQALDSSDEKISELESVRGQLLEASKDRDSLSRNCSEMKEKTQCMEMQMETLKMTCQCLQEEMFKLQAFSKELKDENGVLCEARDATLTALKSIKDQFSVSQAESGRQSAELDLLKEHNVDLQKQLASANTKEGQSPTIESDSLASYLQRVEVKILHSEEDYDKEFETLCPSLDSFSSRLKEEFGELRTKGCELELSLSNAQVECRGLSERNEELEAEIETLKNCRIESDCRLSEMESNQRDLKARLEEADDRNAVLSDGNTKLVQDVDVLKSELTTLSKIVEESGIEKEAFFSDVKALFSSLFPHESLDKEDQESVGKMLENLKRKCEGLGLKMKDTESQQELAELRFKYEESQAEIGILTENLNNQIRKSEDLQGNIAECSDWSSKFEVAEEEKRSLQTSYSQLSAEYDKSTKDVEFLKQQLDEYENDIQKHLNLEQENFSLQDMLKELEGENFRLTELYENKCDYVSDVMCRLSEIIACTKEKLNQDIVSSEDDDQMVLSLQSLFDSICVDLDKKTEAVDILKTEVKEANRINEGLSSELSQVMDLKQFLEDENTELRDEVCQLKSEKEKSGKTTATLMDSLSVHASNDKSSIAIQVSQDTITSEARVGNKETLRRTSVSDIVNEWGFIPHSESNNDLLMNLQQENERITSILETKSGLVEKIHCEVDFLLSKVEDLNAEMAEKESDLKAARDSNASLQKEVKNLKNSVSRLQKCSIKIIPAIKDIEQSVHDSHSTFVKYWQESVSSVQGAIGDIKSEYIASIDDCKSESLAINDKYGQLQNSLCQLFGEVVSLLESVALKCKNLKLPTDLDIQSFLRTIDVEDPHFMDVFASNIRLIIKSVKFMCDLCIEKTSAHISKAEDNVNNANVPLVNVNLESSDACDRSKSPCSSCEQFQNQLSESELKLYKLKVLAVKQKKEINETREVLESTKDEKQKMTSAIDELTSELEHISALHRQHVMNFQNLQLEYDKSQDEGEKLKAENKTFQDDLVSTFTELNGLRQKLSDKDEEVKRSVETFEMIQQEKLDLKSKIADLESRLIVLDSKHSDSLAKIQQLSDELLNSQREVNNLTNDKDLLSKKVEDALIETKQHSLLDLEMADYERTISELTDQIDSRNSEVSALRSKVETYVSRIQTLEDEMKFCENHRLTEENRAEGFKESLENTKKELVLLKDRESSLKDDVTELSLKLETLSLQEQDHKSRLSLSSAEVDQMKEMLRSSGENHQRIVHSLNTKISTQKQDILMAHKEVESVKQDFESYKIRVHSVLKQQKTVTPFTSDDAEVKEKLEAQNDKLKLQLKDVSDKLHALKLESETQYEEHDHLLQRHSKVVEELEAKDEQWNQRLQHAVDEKNKLQALLENATSEHSLKNEMLAATYKKQIKFMQEEQKCIIEELQRQLESADVEISRLQREHQRNNPSSAISAFPQEDNSSSFDIFSQERQEGEGSECTDGGGTPIRHLSLATIPTSGFLPLEKLLQSPVESQTPTSLISNQDSDRLNSELNSSWRKIDHLSELLNESEANNVRLSDQVRVLKEEIRRQERNKQREEHAKNMEYLKNVIIKFISLESGSEKASLVPVLNTLLKLSPTESQQLKAAAGDTDVSNSSVEGWGNYLHRWSGLS